MKLGHLSIGSVRDSWFPVLLLVLVGIRFVHLGEFVDEPHAWRQCDTANYIWSFYLDGIDLLHPSVCWMGGHKTTIMEFPLPEAIISIFYKIFGPSLIWARIVFLTFFLGAVRYFYLIVKLFGGKGLAEFACIFYLAFPLGIYYSRAIHIDFTAIFFAHAMLYHFLIGTQREQWWHILTGGLLGGIGFMIKSPYLFFLYLPLVAWIHHHRKWKFTLRTAVFFILPIVLFIPWQMHVNQVNAKAPDWDFIPRYKKFVDMWGWYFGVWEMREVGSNWMVIFNHIRYEILAYWGLWAAIIGIVCKPFSLKGNMIRLWLLGACIYVLVFFNLNFVHNYYQIPLMAPLALCMALFCQSIQEQIQRFISNWAVRVMLIPIVLFAWRAWELTEQRRLNETEKPYFQYYYQLQTVSIAGGQAIREHTPDRSLIIISYGGFDCRAPMILYRARRYGWSIPQADLTPEIVEKLREEGAEYLAVILIGPIRDMMNSYLDQFPHQSYPLQDTNLSLELYSLEMSPQTTSATTKVLPPTNMRSY